ncbi:IS66 family transposase zinc-finger binding domain-containing protein [Endozoicomonas ascidiicola]|uniref:IS66 family transposase zinc-finger binding domain-containing protein n=1 Tax=Endozoicomonas ascidiicola TaxID=1698521 RepID=UPI000830EA14|nr:IS66 family transposase zinc-finger binding domain-containing protein [Endozoicomonas ascidiicola]
MGYLHTRKNALLEERLHCLLQKQFGASSEKISPDQQDLFNEAEQDQPEPDSEPEEQAVTVPEHTRGRKPLPEDLPRVRKEHDLSDEEKVCGCCGGDLHQIGEEITEQLEIIPAKIQVIQNVRFKYGCRSCEDSVNLKSSVKNHD